MEDDDFTIERCETYGVVQSPDRHPDVSLPVSGGADADEDKFDAIVGMLEDAIMGVVAQPVIACT
jgi:hypothetical protein